MAGDGIIAQIKHDDTRQLKRQLHDGGEVAPLDAREEGVFAQRHLLMASYWVSGLHQT